MHLGRHTTSYAIKKEGTLLIIIKILTESMYHDIEFLIFTNANLIKRISVILSEFTAIDELHRAAAEWTLRQSIPRSPQVSSPQGKTLYATLLLAVCDAAQLVPD